MAAAPSSGRTVIVTSSGLVMAEVGAATALRAVAAGEEERIPEEARMEGAGKTDQVNEWSLR